MRCRQAACACALALRKGVRATKRLTMCPRHRRCRMSAAYLTARVTAASAAAASTDFDNKKLKMWWSEGGGGAVLALQILKHAAATPVAAPAALQHQRARALFCSHLHAKHFRATPVPPHNCLQLQRCLCCLSQTAHKHARLVAPHYALHSQGCARGNDPVVHVSTDKVTAVDAANYGGACVAVPV